MVRSLSDRTLALLAAPIQDVLMTLFGFWAQAVLLLLTAAPDKLPALDGSNGQETQDMYVDAPIESKLAVDDSAMSAPVKVLS
ncbi:hypothetical protein PHBOTO_004757 [Pseudozyma hubeiensis]|nr:hypothetical protein PHBOTO_004757 [Pseudozyma hubeiensis]